MDMKREKTNVRWIKTYEKRGQTAYAISFMFRGWSVRKRGFISADEALLEGQMIRKAIIKGTYDPDQFSDKVIKKPCVKCKELKPDTTRYFYKSSIGNEKGICKSCMQKNSRKWYKQNREKALLKKKEQYDNQSAGLYKIINKKTGRFYIGASGSLQHRWYAHRSELNAQRHSNKCMQEDYNEHGADIFEFQILQEYAADTPINFLVEIERVLIKYLISDGKDLYNTLVHEN